MPNVLQPVVRGVFSTVWRAISRLSSGGRNRTMLEPVVALLTSVDRRLEEQQHQLERLNGRVEYLIDRLSVVSERLR